MSEIKLLPLPCPFCGIQLENEFPSKIWCHPKNDCLLSLRGIAGEDQIKVWNTRKPMQKIVERLEQKRRGSNQCPKFEKAFRQVAFEEAIQIVGEVGGMNG